MNFTEAITCLVKGKCDTIWRLDWGNKKESNRIKYNSFDGCLEFVVNNKIYYPKDICDLLALDWQAVRFEGIKDVEVKKYIISSKECIVYDSIKQLQDANKNFKDVPIALTGIESIIVYTEENDFYKAFYGKEKDDIIFELTSILDTTIDMVSRGQLISTTTLNKARSILDKVSDGVY